MRHLAVAAYAARSVLRRRLGTTSALIGLALGVAVASAPWVAIDSTLRGLTDYYLGRVPIDLIGLAAPGVGSRERNAWNASQNASRVPYVVQAEPILEFALVLNRSGVSQYVQAYWIRPTFAQATARLGITWSARPATGGVVVHDSLRLAGLEVGNTVSLFENPSWTLTRRIDGFYNTTPDAAFRTTDLFLPESDLRDAKSALKLSGSNLAVELFIWLDRGALVNPYDPEGTAARLLREHTLLDDALKPHDFYLGRGGIEEAVQSLVDQVRLLRIWFLPFTIPTIAMAILLSRVGFDIGLTGRRRELAVLRARGLSVRAVHGFLLVEMTVVSILAALAGLGIALLLSRILLTHPMFLANFSGNPTMPSAELAVSPTTLAFVIGFAWALGWLASRRALKFALSKDVVSAFRAYHQEEVAIPHRASRDLLLMALGGAGLILLALFAFSGAYSGFAAWLGIPTTVLAPVAPILLTIGLVRYLTRGTTKVYRALARLLRPFLGKVEPLVDKNLARAPRRASNIAMIVTFAMAFLVAMPILTASSDAYLNEQARWGTPSDILISGTPSGTFGRKALDLWSSGQVGAIPGVADVTPVFEARTTGLGTIWVFNASSYLRTVPWLEPRHLLGVDPRQLMQDLAKGGALAANAGFQRVSGLQVGDPVSLSLADRNGSVVATFTGRFAAQVPTLPGMSYGPTWPQWYLDFSALPPGVIERLGSLSRLFLALTPGANSTSVVASLRALFGDTAYVRTSEEAVQIELTNPVRAGIFQYLVTQSELAAVLMVLGIGLLVFSAASARRNELVTLVARGLGPELAARLVMAEGWIVALLGILLGTSTGLLVAASVLQIISSYTTIPIPFVVPWTVVLPVLVVTGGVWAASFLGAFAIQRMDVARVLKLRGG